jgi:signal transduction histidine kinase
MSDLGQQHVQGPELDAGRSSLEIDFFGVELRAAEALRYRHRLEGLETDWTDAGRLHTVRYAGLPAGSYRFLVEPLAAGGAASAAQATVSFTILPPLWRRWWFLASAVALAGLALRAAERYRVARLLELERVRTRIATDLHDDVGSSLSQIAILSEVARQRLGPDGGGAAEALGSIAATSREMVDSIGDIVWAINPRKDHLRDLTQRMRRSPATS